MNNVPDVSGGRVKIAALAAGALAALAPFGLISVSVENSSTFRFFSPDNSLRVFASMALFLSIFIIPVILHEEKTRAWKNSARFGAFALLAAFIQLPGMIVCGGYSLSGQAEPFISEAVLLAVSAAASGAIILFGTKTYLLAAFLIAGGVPFINAVFFQFGGAGGLGFAVISPFWAVGEGAGIVGAAAWALVAMALWLIIFLKRKDENNS